MKRKDFYIGQRLITPERHKEEWNCDDFVRVTEIHKTKDIVHYELKLHDQMDGTLHSGMYFDEAEEDFGKPTKK